MSLARHAEHMRRRKVHKELGEGVGMKQRYRF